MGGFGQEIGGGGSDDEQLGLLGELDVRAERKLRVVEDIAGDGPAGERGKRRRADELLGRGVITTETPAPPCTSWLTSAAVL